MAEPGEPADAADTMSFTILKSSNGDLRARLGRLACQKRRVIETPHYVGIASRGVIPHLSQDTMAKKTNLQGIYVALEDFIEQASSSKTPPLFNPQNISSSDPLRNFIALSADQLLILGARRTPPVLSPHSNTQTAVSIYTSVGFGMLEATDFADAARKLKPDILVALGDIPFGNKPGQRRTGKMSSRTEQHMRGIISNINEDASKTLLGKIFAPILPIEREQQMFYFDLLEGEWRDFISGLAIYDADTATELPETLEDLPRLSLAEAGTPHQLLREIALGIDIFTIPFIGATTDAGLALSFRFQSNIIHESGEQRQPLGILISASEHACSLQSLVDSCECFACTKHHRAYLHHLLATKEMLAWVLLQIHNLAIMDNFFSSVRRSIAAGTFESDVQAFTRTYEATMPEGTGTGPRVRGYQYRSEGPGEAKRNPSAFSRMLQDRREQNADAPMPDANAGPDVLADQGFAKPARES